MKFVLGLVVWTLCASCAASSFKEFQKRAYEDNRDAGFEDFDLEDLAHLKAADLEDEGVEGSGFADAEMDEELASALFPEGADSTEYCETVREVERATIIRSPVNAERKYPNLLDCVWRVQAPENQTVRINFRLFKVQNSKTCTPDFVTIHDGALKTDPLITKLCGFRRNDQSYPAGTYSSTGQFLTIRFRSNKNVQMRGWVARVEFQKQDACTGTTVLPASTDTKYFSFPSFGLYQTYLECGWLIQAPPGQFVEFNHTMIDMENYYLCESDYLEFHDGSTTDATAIGNRICGTLDNVHESELVKRSTGRNMFVFFKTDSSTNGEGFQGQYKAVSTPGIPLCPSSAVELSGNGTIIFPARGDRYVNHIRCEWRFNASEGQKIKLTFQRFKTEYNRWCSTDHLKFYDSSSVSPIHYMCGLRGAGYEFISPTNYLLMRFTSDSSNTYTGFEVDYEPVDEVEDNMPVFGCSEIPWVIPPGGGIIQVPLHGSTYDNNLICVWTLYAPDNHVVRVKFLSVDIDPSPNCAEDRVDIAQGDQIDSSSLIGQVCGTSRPTFISETNVMTIRFVTNHEGVASGFKLTILPGMNGTCGSPLITRRRSKRIVGGQIAEPHSWPWMVSINHRTYGYFICSGTIISRYWIVASNCISPSYYDEVLVLAGAHLKQWSNSGETTRQVKQIAEIIRYPGYSGIGTAPELSLVRLTTPLDFDPQSTGGSVHPVCLPPGNVPVPDYTSCFTTGWGNTYNHEDRNTLNELEFTVVPQDVCNGSNYHNNEIHEYELCAENSGVVKNLCSGDRGNPLVCLINGKYELHGIASWNLVTCDTYRPSEKPAVFTRITELVDWINSNAVPPE